MSDLKIIWQCPCFNVNTIQTSQFKLKKKTFKIFCISSFGGGIPPFDIGLVLLVSSLMFCWVSFFTRINRACSLLSLQSSSTCNYNRNYLKIIFISSRLHSIRKIVLFFIDARTKFNGKIYPIC